MKFDIGDHESRASMRSSDIPIWVENQFRPVIARLISGDAELLAEWGLWGTEYKG